MGFHPLQHLLANATWDWQLTNTLLVPSTLWPFLILVCFIIHSFITQVINFSNEKAFGPQGGVTITYSNGEISCDEDKDGRTAVINLVCDITGLAPNSGQLVNAYESHIERLNLLVYSFVLVSQYACPQPPA